MALFNKKRQAAFDNMSVSEKSEMLIKERKSLKKFSIFSKIAIGIGALSLLGALALPIFGVAFSGINLIISATLLTGTIISNSENNDDLKEVDERLKEVSQIQNADFKKELSEDVTKPFKLGVDTSKSISSQEDFVEMMKE